VNGLLSLDWLSPATAAGGFYKLGIVPLFDYYIVTKAQAAKNIVAHVVMYAPIGVMMWLRAKNGGGGSTAFGLAAFLSAIVEIGRFFRPGLVPDINAIPLAGAAAWATAAAMPVLWRMLAAVAVGRPALVSFHLSEGVVSTPILNWRDRADRRGTRRHDPVEDTRPAGGDVEHY